ncbi:MAG: hypothetical protein ACK52W_07840, partial [Alphaproteobacteria bacterium]
MQAQEVTLPPAADFATAAPVVNDPIYAGTPPPIAPLPPAPPVSRFIEQNRIHVEHGSVFD